MFRTPLTVEVRRSSRGPGERSAPRLRVSWPRLRAGITIVEVLVVLTLIVLVLLLLSPIIDQIRAQSLITDCSNNLRQICAALEMYHIRHEDWLPANQKDGSWRTYLDPDLRAPFVPYKWEGSSPMWRCPVGGEYFANNLVIGDNRYDRDLYRTHWKVSMFPRPTRVPIITDALPGDYSKAAIGGFDGIDYRHAGGAVILFLDCRVEWIKKANMGETEKWWKEPRRGEYKPAEPESPEEAGEGEGSGTGGTDTDSE